MVPWKVFISEPRLKLGNRVSSIAASSRLLYRLGTPNRYSACYVLFDRKTNEWLVEIAPKSVEPRLERYRCFVRVVFFLSRTIGRFRRPSQYILFLLDPTDQINNQFVVFDDTFWIFPLTFLRNGCCSKHPSTRVFKISNATRSSKTDNTLFRSLLQF